VKERDLHDALKNGTIFAAGLDVTDPEPPLADNQPLRLPNCVIAPHVASATVATRTAMANIAARTCPQRTRRQGLPHCEPGGGCVRGWFPCGRCDTRRASAHDVGDRQSAFDDERDGGGEDSDDLQPGDDLHRARQMRNRNDADADGGKRMRTARTAPNAPGFDPSAVTTCRLKSHSRASSRAPPRTELRREDREDPNSGV
jgi:hypothetical protein